MPLKGSGLGRVRVGGGLVVKVPKDDTGCASCGHLFVCVNLNLRRLAGGEFACY